MLKLDELFRNQELVFHSADLDFEREKYYFLQFLVDILPLGFGSVDMHIFADPDLDPGSQNPVDPTDSDPVSIAAGF